MPRLGESNTRARLDEEEEKVQKGKSVPPASTLSISSLL